MTKLYEKLKLSPEKVASFVVFLFIPGFTAFLYFLQRRENCFTATRSHDTKRAKKRRGEKVCRSGVVIINQF